LAFVFHVRKGAEFGCARGTVLSQMRKFKSFPLLLAIVLIGIAGIAFYLAMVGVRQEEPVMTASENLAAYTYVSGDELQVTNVPSSSITDNDLTESEYSDQFADEEGGLVLTAPLLSGQRVDQREVASGDAATFAVVTPAERVVAAATSPAGSALGAVQAGDVVDVQVESGGVGDSGAQAQFAKVLCLSVSSGDCEGILPPGAVTLPAVEEGSEESINLLLAVDVGSASGIAGQSVVLSLNPFCKVDPEGFFIDARSDVSCNPPRDRQPTEDATIEETDDTATDEETVPEEEGDATAPETSE
jgi:hypothetical protein